MFRYRKSGASHDGPRLRYIFGPGEPSFEGMPQQETNEMGSEARHGARRRKVTASKGAWQTRGAVGLLSRSGRDGHPDQGRVYSVKPQHDRKPCFALMPWPAANNCTIAVD